MHALNKHHSLATHKYLLPRSACTCVYSNLDRGVSVFNARNGMRISTHLRMESVKLRIVYQSVKEYSQKLEIANYTIQPS